MQTLDAFDKRFPDEESCRQYLFSQRWPKSARCPRCGNENVYALKARPFNWVCKSGKKSTNKETGEVLTCGKNGYRFSVITHTIFENTKRPLKSWFKIAFLMLVSKKGVSALQLHRMMYGSKHLNNYHTTWYQCMRLRAAMKDSEWEQLMGVVEIDEVYHKVSKDYLPLYLSEFTYRHNRRNADDPLLNSYQTGSGSPRAGCFAKMETWPKRIQIHRRSSERQKNSARNSHTRTWRSSTA